MKNIKQEKLIKLINENFKDVRRPCESLYENKLEIGYFMLPEEKITAEDILSARFNRRDEKWQDLTDNELIECRDMFEYSWDIDTLLYYIPALMHLCVRKINDTESELVEMRSNLLDFLNLKRLAEDDIGLYKLTVDKFCNLSSDQAMVTQKFIEFMLTSTEEETRINAKETLENNWEEAAPLCSAVN